MQHPHAAFDLGLFQIGLAYMLMTRAVRRVSALEVGLLLLLEPVLSPVWAWLVHGETPATIALLGGGIIIAATAIYTIVGERGAGSQVRRLGRSVGGEVWRGSHERPLQLMKAGCS